MPTRTIEGRATSSTSGIRSGTRSRPRRDTHLPHGQAVALGMVAALQLSGNDAALAAVREQLDPQPVRVDREAAWAALARDKKTVGGAPRLVLLERSGEPTWGNEVPAADVRAALDSLIAD